MASLVVLIVAVPLSLGIALASGLSPLAGLVSAIIGGIVVGLLSGAPLMVSGPAAGLSVLVFQIAQTHGFMGVIWCTLLCGILQFVFGIFRWGTYFRLVPKTILEGMLAAIGLIILLGQLHVLVGASVPTSPIQSIIMLPEVFGAKLALGKEAWIILALGIFGVGFHFLWPKISSKMKWMPAALPAVVLVTLMSLAFAMPRIEISSWKDAFSFLTFADLNFFNGSTLLYVLTFGIALAIVASAESLLTARATDVLAKEKGIQHNTKLNKEVMAQGAGNIFAALLGGLPITGVIVRSSANIQAGGQTRWSAVLHGFWVLLFMTLFPFILSSIPLVALAAVLIVTGIKLLHPSKIKAIFSNKGEGLEWLVTFLGIVFFNLLAGLIAGILFALARRKLGDVIPILPKLAKSKNES